MDGQGYYFAKWIKYTSGGKCYSTGNYRQSDVYILNVYDYLVHVSQGYQTTPYGYRDKHGARSLFVL